MLEKAGIGGLTTAIITMTIFGRNTMYQLPMSKTIIPFPLVGFIFGAINSNLVDLTHMLVKNEIPLGSKTTDQASLALNAILSAGFFYGILSMNNAETAMRFGFWKAIATGAISELASSALYEYLIGQLHI
jgi:hypothetical protein